MYHIRLIHWNATEAQQRAGELCSLGYEVANEPLDQAGLRALREDPPDAIVIDLSRAPSRGREVALGLRKYKTTRHVPLVLVGGAPEKVARIKELLPDAAYTNWREVQNALGEAIAHPPKDPVVPGSVFDAYAGTPLPKKLGIKVDSAVALLGAPERFEDILGDLPPGVELCRDTGKECDVTLWFVRSRQDLEDGIDEMGTLAKGGGLWIVWPKKASGVASDLSQPVVREVGLASGLVDFKVCSVDATWTGLRFTQRKSG